MKYQQESDEVSELDVSSTLEPLEEESPRSQETQLASTRRWLQFLQSSLLLLSCLASLAIAAAGFSLLVYIFFSRSFAPPMAHIAKELYFDYADTAATATASFLDTPVWKSKSLPPRVLPPGQQINIWLELEAAEAHGTVNTDVFQVVGQLLTADGKVAATASRPCLLTYWAPTLQYVRSLLSAPLVLTGFWREHQLLKVPLFSRYPDQPDKPFVEFRAVLRAAHKGAQLPHLYSAKVHVDLILGFFGRLVYLMRPGTWTMLLLAMAALSAIGGGLLAAAILFFFWLYSAPKVHAPSHSPPQSDIDAESDFGAQDEFPAGPLDLAEGLSEPVPRLGSSSKEAVDFARVYERKGSVELLLKESKLATTPGLVYRGPQKQMEAG